MITKNYLKSTFLVLTAGLLFNYANAQSVHIDTHSDASGDSIWHITTTHPHELILISADGYGDGQLNTDTGTVKVGNHNATYLTRGEFDDGEGDNWVASIWAFVADTAGTYTMTTHENYLQSPFYFNYATAVYDTNAWLNLNDILIGGNDSNQNFDTANASIATTANNSYVYGTTSWNDNGGFGTLKWYGGLTELDNDYISDGVDCAQAGATITSAGTQHIMVSDSIANSPWATLALVAVQPPTCNLSIHIDSLIASGCKDSIWAVVTGGSTPYNYIWTATGDSTRDTIGHLCPGTYKVVVSDNHGCRDSASISLVISTGINGINNLSNQVQLYPNPFSGVVNVDISTPEPLYVDMYNMLGENIGEWKTNAGHNSINTESYPAGIYMFQIKTLDGTVLSKKLVKTN